MFFYDKNKRAQKRHAESIEKEGRAAFFYHLGNIAVRYFRNHDKSSLRSIAHERTTCAHKNLYFVIRAFFFWGESGSSADARSGHVFLFFASSREGTSEICLKV